MSLRTAVSNRGRCVFGGGGAYRYILTRVLGPFERSVVFVMLNPSTADEAVDDATIRRCAGHARSWGCGALEVVNLFALRSTDPAALLSHPDPVGPDNDIIISGAVALADLLVVAWGDSAPRLSRDRARMVLGVVRAAGKKPLCLSVNASGNPRHPLYSPYRGWPLLFDAPWSEAEVPR